MKYNKNNNIYPIICSSYANLDMTLDIWIKFTSHLKPEEKEILEKFKSKTIGTINSVDFEQYLQIKKRLWKTCLFKKYQNKKCSKEEIHEVISFMHSPLEDFMIERLTESEKQEADFYLLQMNTLEELKEYQEKKQKDYINLSISEAYVLFKVKEKIYDLEQDFCQKRQSR